MTIKYEDRFRQARPAGFDGVFDWDFLLPAFEGTKIQPMDLDAIVERNGYFLVLETKAPGVGVSLGQKITFKALMRLGRFTIFFIVGKTEREIEWLTEWHWRNNRLLDPVEHPNANADVVLERARQWFRWADKRVAA